MTAIYEKLLTSGLLIILLSKGFSVSNQVVILINCLLLTNPMRLAQFKERKRPSITTLGLFR